MKTNWQDPQTSEIRSTHISGLQEAVGKIEDILDMQLVAETNVPLTEVYISANDRYRIYQAPAGKRNWAASPAPVIKKNGVQITSGFTIDYGGGAIILSPPATSTDVFTADVYRTKTDGNKLAMHLAEKAQDSVKDPHGTYTEFSERAINVKWFGASGSTQTTTGSITAGSAILTLASALDFKNGQGITVNHAGAACTLATPGAPTVTPTGTAGTTEYQYQIVALDGKGGCTAASPAGVTTTGNATLDATNYNALSWTAVAGAVAYAVYGRVSGAMQLLAIVSGTSWNDKGTAAITPPSTLPSTPPASALADTLITTIVSGGGTTTLTLATTATTTATGQEVGHDDTAAIQAAIDASIGGKLIFPSGNTFLITSSLIIPSDVNIDFNGSTIKRKAGSGTFNMLINSDTTIGNTNIKLYNLLIDGNKDADGLVPGANNFGGLVFYKVTNSELKNITVTNTVNNEDVAGIYFKDCSEINAYNINGYSNDKTAILIWTSSRIKIFGSYTHDNLGSGVSSYNSPECEYHFIKTHNNGYSNLSVNGLRCKVSNVLSYNAGNSGVNVGHINQPTDDTEINNVISYNNTYEGLTISNSSNVQINNLTVYGNARNNIRISEGATNCKFTNMVSKNSAGGQGMLIESGIGHTIDNAEFFLNAVSGIYISTGVEVSIGCNVKCYNNGQITSANSAGILLNSANNCKIIGAECYDNQSTKTQETGLWIAGGSGHIIALCNIHDNKTYQIRVNNSPTNIKYINNPGTTSLLQVSNALTASTLGTLTHKIEIFDANGNSIGFIPVYYTIT